MSRDPLSELVTDHIPDNTIATIHFVEQKPKPNTYNAGYQTGFHAGKQSRGDFHTLKRDRYAKMWVQANRWNVPDGIRLPLNLGNPEHAFVHGIFAVLELLHADGLLTDKMLDRYWNEETLAGQVRDEDII